jgi:acyl-CoA reductase-like NAD-dependent aldehyde dehydrogenase
MLVRNLIARPAAAPASHTTFNVVHPGSGAAIHQVERSTAVDLTSAIDAAAAGLPKWKATTLEQRKAVVTRVCELLADETNGWAAKLVKANMEETPVPEFWSAAQIHMAVGSLKTLVESADAALAEQTLTEGHCEFVLWCVRC